MVQDAIFCFSQVLDILHSSPLTNDHAAVPQPDYQVPQNVSNMHNKWSNNVCLGLTNVILQFGTGLEGTAGPDAVEITPARPNVVETTPASETTGSAEMTNCTTGAA
jgi:hypothetical protein